MHKLGIIVPYRKRFKQLQRFLKCVPDYLQRQNINYEIIVAEQMGEEDFNRGALLNAGFLEAKKRGCDYVVFHDVDLLPRYVDYSYSDIPLELVGKVLSPEFEEAFQIDISDNSDDYFGGVTLFPVEFFEKINGYSNKYIGWGFEDNDILLRCREAQVPLDSKRYRQYQATEPAFTFDGNRSYIQVPFLEKHCRKTGMSFLVNFRVEDLKADRDLPHDECAIFCIPGLDAALCYESFGTYKFEVFDNYEDVYSIHTKKYPVGITLQAIITLDFQKRTGKFYLNGEKIGEFKWPEDRVLKFGSNSIYLGVGHPTREVESNSSQKWLQGQIADFATFSRVLDKFEIRELYQQSFLGLNRFQPLQWYSGKVTADNNQVAPNIADNQILTKDFQGFCSNITIEPLISPDEFYRISVPYKRTGVFVAQPHTTAGTTEGYWKSWVTRLNQFKYGEAESLGTFKSRDGLSSFSKIAEITRRKLVTFPGAIHIQVTFKEQ